MNFPTNASMVFSRYFSGAFRNILILILPKNYKASLKKSSKKISKISFRKALFWFFFQQILYDCFRNSSGDFSRNLFKHYLTEPSMNSPQNKFMYSFTYLSNVSWRNSFIDNLSKFRGSSSGSSRCSSRHTLRDFLRSFFRYSSKKCLLQNLLQRYLKKVLRNP